METQRGNNASLTYLTDEQGREIEEQKRIGEAFHRYFTRLFGEIENLNRGQALRDFLCMGGGDM